MIYTKILKLILGGTCKKRKLCFLDLTDFWLIALYHVIVCKEVAMRNEELGYGKGGKATS